MENGLVRISVKARTVPPSTTTTRKDSSIVGTGVVVTPSWKQIKLAPALKRASAAKIGRSKIRLIEAKRVYDELHDAPNSNHEKKADDAGERKVAAFLARLFVMREEKLRDTNNKNDECDEEDERDHDPVEDSEDDKQEINESHRLGNDG